MRVVLTLGLVVVQIARETNSCRLMRFLRDLLLLVLVFCQQSCLGESLPLLKSRDLRVAAVRHFSPLARLVGVAEIALDALPWASASRATHSISIYR